MGQRWVTTGEPRETQPPYGMVARWGPRLPLEKTMFGCRTHGALGAEENQMKYAWCASNICGDFQGSLEVGNSEFSFSSLISPTSKTSMPARDRGHMVEACCAERRKWILSSNRWCLPEKEVWEKKIVKMIAKNFRWFFSPVTAHWAPVSHFVSFHTFLEDIFQGMN